jgi:uncharacterized protein YcaQ
MSAIAQNRDGFALPGSQARSAGSQARSAGSRIRVETLSVAQARRIALAAQGFTDPRPAGQVARRHLRRVLSRTALLQIDSVNVLQRAHYMPMFSRLGSYPVELLDRAAQRSPRDVFEYWGHMASFVPVELHPFLRWRMAEAHTHAWGRMREIVSNSPGIVEWVLQEVRERGPLTAGQIELDVPTRTKLHWGWNWSDAKSALEWLFWTGEVTTAGRNSGFARLYDLTERVLPAEVLRVPTPDEPEQFRQLVRFSARSLGVGAEIELRDYFRLTGPRFHQALAELVEDGTLRPVVVQGWKPRAYLYADAKLPRRVSAAALISPFDPLIWERNRTERLFNFHYRIGIYTVPAERVHGYYALPFLLDDRLVARVDLKADRKAGVLLVPGAWVEPGQPPGAVAERLAPVLVELAEWLGLDAISPPEQGDLASALAGTLVASAGSTVVA